jgi:O-methyltransferase
MSNEISAFIQAAHIVVRSEQPWKVDSSSRYFHQTALPFATLAPWYTDGEFIAAYEKIQANTLVDLYRIYELWSLAKQTKNVEGDILEVGVWRGGTGALLAEATKEFTEKKVYLADTFRGVVKATEKDPSYSGGEHSDTSVEIVQQLIESMGLANTQLLVGEFPEESGGEVRGGISLLHCDVDVYQSAKDLVEWAVPRLSMGAVIVFDDYGFSTCEGIATYVDEFRINPEFRFIHNLNGHAIFIKVA